jgi:hypothetical protein
VLGWYEEEVYCCLMISVKIVDLFANSCFCSVSNMCNDKSPQKQGHVACTNKLFIIVYKAISYSNKGVSILDIIVAEHEFLNLMLDRYMQSTSFKLLLLALLFLAPFRDKRFGIRPICPL